ncbi:MULTISPECIES: hypothetical protein [Streptococcus]|uniref:hypothetical protein n=1 Tax=Streptococcus TaxID=1301 RepID=UPI000A7F92C4|nr:MULTISPECIES: hypothetical protein [Streptococcus]MCB6406580.1 hypothetical protein [Streptococcus gordonii]MDN5021025.1 hypothetical protein [Streptococcus sp. SG2]RSJ35883.1 hypothetical protein D8821_02145 [Streptococcus gordonii]RSJ36513.1 hypothetical protein D8822_05385 [Streptococcus gordonii]
MEEYLNLYHQKLWEIAFGHVEKVFGVFFVILLVLSILPIYIFFNSLVRRKKLILVLICIPFLMFILCIAAEYAYSYDKIMNPDSPYNDSLMVASLRHETVLPILEHVDEIPLDSVDGKLKRDDILVFALSNPTYYDALFADIANSLAGEQTIGKAFLVALVGYEEKNGEWQSVDIRIAPGVEEKDFQKFSKVLHIKKDEAEGATGIILDLQKFYELKLRKEKDGHGPKL